MMSLIIVNMIYIMPGSYIGNDNEIQNNSNSKLSVAWTFCIQLWYV